MLLLLTFGGTLMAEDAHGEAEPVSTAHFFRVDLIIVGRDYIVEDEAIAAAFGELIERDVELAERIASFWRTKARAQLREFLQDEIDRAFRTKATPEEQKITALRAADTAIHGYYFDHWKAIRQMIEKNLARTRLGMDDDPVVEPALPEDPVTVEARVYVPLAIL